MYMIGGETHSSVWSLCILNMNSGFTPSHLQNYKADNCTTVTFPFRLFPCHKVEG